MGIIEAFTGAIVKVVTTVTTAVATAIAAPTVATITTAVATVGVVAAGGFVAKKAFDFVSDKVSEKVSANNDTHHYAGKSKSNDKYCLKNGADDRQTSFEAIDVDYDDYDDDEPDTDLVIVKTKKQKNVSNSSREDAKLDKIINRIENRHHNDENDDIEYIDDNVYVTKKKKRRRFKSNKSRMYFNRYDPDIIDVDFDVNDDYGKPRYRLSSITT